MGKACRHYPFLGSWHCTCHHLTQPAGLASLNRSTGSMAMALSLNDHAVGTTVVAWLNYKNVMSTGFAYLESVGTCEIHTCEEWKFIPK